MIFWTFDWSSIGINETGEGIAVFFDHWTEHWKDTGLKLDPILFEINLPFYMESEEWWKFKDRDPSSKHHQRSIYSLSCREKNLFAWIKEQVNPAIAKTEDDNSRAKAKAKQIHLRSSGINTLLATKILCNLTNSTILINKIFQDYLIPRQSCFAICDVRDGLRLCYENLINDEAIVGDNEKFLIVIDPPWDNKSVKRKHSYSTLDPDQILETFLLLEKICKLLLHRHNLDIRIILWTTEKQKSLCFEKLLPILEMKPVACLLWHKITNSWESSKIHGGREYLIIASLNGPQIPLEGVFVSKPSSIHSHKPPIGFDLPWFQQLENNRLQEPLVISHKSTLTVNKCSKLRGIELYARYLRPNFLSIGFECIKLQSIDMFHL